MGIKGILFDKDDTLIDLGTYWCKPTKICIDMLLKKYAAENNDELRRKLELAGGFDDDRLIPGSVVVTGTNLETMYLFKDIFEEYGIEVDEGFCRYGEVILEECCLKYGEIKAKGDVLSLMDYLKSNKILIALATGDQRISAINCLNKLGITDYFDMIITSDDVKNQKPHPEMIDKFMFEYKLGTEEVLRVGDSASDMKMACNAHVAGLLIGDNKVKSDYRLDKLDNIIEWINDKI